MKEQREIFSADTSPLKRVNGKQSSGLNNNVESRKNKNDKLVANGNGLHLDNKKGSDIRFVNILPTIVFFSVQKNGGLKSQGKENHIVRIDEKKKKKEMINVDSKTKPIDPQLVGFYLQFFIISN